MVDTKETLAAINKLRNALKHMTDTNDGPVDYSTRAAKKIMKARFNQLILFRDHMNMEGWKR